MPERYGDDVSPPELEFSGLSSEFELDEPIDLTVCPQGCEGNLVQPISWEEAESSHWRVTCHCPNCDWIGRGVYDEETIYRFDEALNRGTEAMVRDIKKLMRADMEEYVERFIRALKAGQIWPDDLGEMQV